ncbi:MAG: nitronate monooxygenase, partial [candidate division Zixibacteria bacterium]|nr:nitronate monooxygenase [candidate division Zixibacteria bacterium]
MPALDIGGLLVEKPIIQGGMGVGISMSGLASAVANEGGIGVISSVCLGLVKSELQQKYREANKIALRNEIRKTKELTKGIVGLNIMVAVSDFDEMVKIAFEEKVDIVFLGAGLPIKFPKIFPLDELKKSNTKVAVIVSSARAARILFKHWWKNYDYTPDAVVVEGPMAGGHLGFKKEQINNPAYKLENILPEVITVVNDYEQASKKNIPVIAAGGIFTGADIYKFLELGANGIQMATRFVATHECDASNEFKKSYLNCNKNDLTIIDSPVGMPGRAIINNFLDDVSRGVKKPFNCPWKCLKTCDFREAPYCIALALTNAQKGNLKEGYTFAGANAYRIKKIVSVKKLFQTLEKEY